MKIISVVNMKGGVGKTTLSVNLAHCLATKFDSKILVIDLDPQFNATQCIIDGEEYVNKLKNKSHTVYTVYDEFPPDDISMTEVISAKKVELANITPWATQFGFDILPGNLQLYRLEMSAGSGKVHRLRNFLNKISFEEKYDLVIIDTPPTPSVWMSSALIASDYYLVPVKPEPLSRTGIDLLQGVINRCFENFDKNIICAGVVLTMVEQTTKVYNDTIDFFNSQDKWKDKLFSNFLRKRTKIAHAQGEQKLILNLDDPTSKSDLVKITEEFLKRVK